MRAIRSCALSRDAPELAELRSDEALLEERIGVASSLRLERELERAGSRAVDVEGSVDIAEGTKHAVDASADAQEVIASLDSRLRLGEVVDTTADRLGFDDEEDRSIARGSARSHPRAARARRAALPRRLTAADRATAAGERKLTRGNHRPGGHDERRIEAEEARQEGAQKSLKEKRQDKRAAARRVSARARPRAWVAASAPDLDGCRSRRPVDLRAFPQPLAAHHAARQHLPDDHGVAARGAEKPAARGRLPPARTRRIPLMISPPCGLGCFPRLHLRPPRSKLRSSVTLFSRCNDERAVSTSRFCSAVLLPSLKPPNEQSEDDRSTTAMTHVSHPCRCLRR